MQRKTIRQALREIVNNPNGAERVFSRGGEAFDITVDRQTFNVLKTPVQQGSVRKG